MDSTATAALIGGGAAIAGALAAGLTSLAVERQRATASGLEAQRQELREACSHFTAAIARIRSNSHNLSQDPTADSAIRTALEDARVGCERLRILLNHREHQKAARLVLRHAYAVWKQAETGIDPRAEEYPNHEPHERLRKQLTALYVGVRQELGLTSPGDVFEDL